MDRRNALISIALLSAVLGACGTVPRPPPKPAPSREPPAGDDEMGDPLEAMLLGLGATLTPGRQHEASLKFLLRMT